MKGGENVWTICWEKWEPFCPIRRVYSSYRNWHRCSSRKPAGNLREQQASAEKTESGEGGGFDINMLLRIQELMGAMQNNDEDAKLLLALRPHLKDQRQKKLDQAVKLMKLYAVFSAVRENGLLQDLL